MALPATRASETERVGTTKKTAADAVARSKRKAAARIRRLSLPAGIPPFAMDAGPLR
jgi:hypothetical protein